jgi:hypothetical protein
MVPDFKAYQDVSNWLLNKPSQWAQIILGRAALRAVPTMAGTAENWLRHYAVAIFRANLVASISVIDDDLQTYTSAERAKDALQQALRRAYDDGIASHAILSAMNGLLATTGQNSVIDQSANDIFLIQKYYLIIMIQCHCRILLIILY